MIHSFQLNDCDVRNDSDRWAPPQPHLPKEAPAFLQGPDARKSCPKKPASASRVRCARSRIFLRRRAQDGSGLLHRKLLDVAQDERGAIEGVDAAEFSANPRRKIAHVRFVGQLDGMVHLRALLQGSSHAAEAQSRRRLTDPHLV
jgi:hypothetical protein